MSSTNVLGVSDYENGVRGVVSCLAAVQRVMTDASRERRRFSQAVGKEIDFSVSNQDAPGPNATRRLAITGYVEARLSEGGYSACWTFEVLRGAAGWDVTRHLDAGMGGDMETVYQLPQIALATSRQLVQQLPDLILELLTLPAPSVPV